ncbi:tripeptidyl-peptidase 2 [Caerostris extrusa]|uniref:Tripeptidyl-peptidase 2 n=1 Tax=Caerostris extrusa TaxID=172846 RepID=A0AAV4R343_CAEEX|nr:tripeptidyl-peptidase 2 [Caerostris extrusa]
MCDFISLEANKASAENEDSKKKNSLEGDTSTHTEVAVLSEGKSTDDYADITLDKLKEIYVELQKWCDNIETKATNFAEKFYLAHSYNGRLLKLLLKSLDDKRLLENELQIIEICKKLGYNHCADFFERSIYVRHPASYALF